MNICFVYKNFPLDGNYDSGIGKYLYDLSCELKKKHRVFIITTSKKPRVIRSKNMTILALTRPTGKKRSVIFIKHLLNISFYLVKLIKKYKIEIVEFANWEAEGFFFTLFPNKLLRIPVVIRLHTPSHIDNKYNSEVEYLSIRLKEKFEEIFVNQKENHLTTSTVFNTSVCKKIYKLNKKISLIPLGIKIPKKSKSKHENKKTVDILFVGRLEARKGFDILIKAIPKVLSEVKNARFIVVGRENNNYVWVNNLRNSIQYEHLNRVSFMGYISNTKTMDLIYKNADICVVPSRYESFGLTVLQAMSYGKAVVASNTGGILEVIKNNINGLLFENNNPESLATSLIRLLKSKNLRNKLAGSAYRSATENFGISKLSNNTSNFYRSLVNGK